MKGFRAVYLLTGMFFVLSSLSAFGQAESQSQLRFTLDKLKLYCQENYYKDAKCPGEACTLGCQENTGSLQEGCILTCLPKNCLDISVDKCPTDICDVIDGCDKKKACYPKYSEDHVACGQLAYSGPAQCCEGMQKRCGVEFFDGSCDMVGKHSAYGVPLCIPCGNGICNQFENRCNCPEDCK